MFTGLVRALGTVTASEDVDGAARLRVAAGAVRAGLAPGASVAVDGVCLTVASLTPDGFVADVMRETLDRTTVGEYRPGRRVNLEPALRADDRLGGHLVQGHVDGVGRVTARTRTPRWDDLTVAVGPRLARYLAEKGSVAVDGISLTVAGLSRNAFEIAFIPHTLRETTADKWRRGLEVNIEYDIIGKYVENTLRQLMGDSLKPGISIDNLRKHGFID